MLDDSLFASDDVRERQVTMADGSVHTLYFKELPQVKFNRYQEAARSTDEAVRASSVAKLIELSLCEPTGLPAITAERAAQLKPQVANALVSAILEVNGFGTQEKKD